MNQRPSRRGSDLENAGPSPTLVGLELRDNLAEHLLRLLVGDLAGADRAVSAAAMSEHQRADIARAGPVKNAVSTREDDILLAPAIQDAD